MDAIKSFNQVLLYIFKTKQYHQRSSQYDQILKKNEQMYALLAICLSLCPHPKLVEENVNNRLREKYAEKMLRMQRSDEAMFDELFSYACPKFITPSPPNYDEPLVNFNQVRRWHEACGCMGFGRQVWKIDSVDSMLLGQWNICLRGPEDEMDIGHVCGLLGRMWVWMAFH